METGISPDEVFIVPEEVASEEAFAETISSFNASLVEGAAVDRGIFIALHGVELELRLSEERNLAKSYFSCKFDYEGDRGISFVSRGERFLFAKNVVREE